MTQKLNALTDFSYLDLLKKYCSYSFDLGYVKTLIAISFERKIYKKSVTAY